LDAPAPRTFYRIVKHDPPTPDDFLPHSARRPPPGRNPTPEQRASWDAVSTYINEDGARAQALAVRETGRSLGDFIAKLVIPEGAVVAVGAISARGHCDLTADARVLLDAVQLPVTRVDT
jgi:hypothetical protein